MNIHSGARTCPESRVLLVQRVRHQSWTPKQAAAAAGVRRRTAFKWLRRYREEGAPGLRDRSSRPQRQPTVTPWEWRKLIVSLRYYRMTGAQIAKGLGMSRPTVARILHQSNLGRITQLKAVEPVVRYEKRIPGQLLHVDVKKLGRIRGVGHRITGDRRLRARGVGWEYVHVCVDDASRLAHVEVLQADNAEAATGFLHRTLAFYRRHGVRVRKVMTDNAKTYLGTLFQATCQRYRIQHLTIRPYRPCTNGKAERFLEQRRARDTQQQDRHRYHEPAVAAAKPKKPHHTTASPKTGRPTRAMLRWEPWTTSSRRRPICRWASSGSSPSSPTPRTSNSSHRPSSSSAS
jgi:transposase InsO family protein